MQNLCVILHNEYTTTREHMNARMHENLNTAHELQH
jgi:hypothetical protein